VHWILTISLKEPQNFVRKYSFTVKVIIYNLQISTTKYISFLAVNAQEVTFADRTTLLLIGCVNTVQLLNHETPDFIAPTLWTAPTVLTSAKYTTGSGEAAGACVPQPDS